MDDNTLLSDETSASNTVNSPAAFSLHSVHMLHDIYQNGAVLQRRKYRYLGYAYRVFILGLVVTLATFAFEFGTAT